jgi:hypothetical protein
MKKINHHYVQQITDNPFLLAMFSDLLDLNYLEATNVLNGSYEYPQQHITRAVIITLELPHDADVFVGI